MSFLPAINLRRTFLIARRDYLGYVKTIGFWVSFLLPFIGGGFGFLVTQSEFEVTPPRYEMILDETGQHKKGILSFYDEKNKAKAVQMLEGLEGAFLAEDQIKDLKRVLETQGEEALQDKLTELSPSVGKQMKSFSKKLNFIDVPANTIEGIRPYLTGEQTVEIEGEVRALSGLLHIQPTESGPRVSYWSKNINASEAKYLVRDYFRRISLSAYLESGGLSREGYNAVRNNAPKIESFDPSKVIGDTGPEAVTKADKIPYFVAAGLALFLWLAVFSGAYMLLTSMLEEKLNKLLEMMLASTRFSEIIFGKLIGVAALTVTAMAPYIIIGIGAIMAIVLTQDSEIAQALAQSFTPKLVIFFLLFLILGYIFYGACFIAMGALSQSMQDAQTITTPIVIVLTLCVMVVPLGLNSPDSPLLRFASFFPLSSPFAVISRLPSDPPLWELIVSAIILTLCALGVVWAASRVFRYGVLSGSGVGVIQAWFKRAVLRRKS